METFDRDIHPHSGLVRNWPELQPLVDNKEVMTAFRRHGRRAVFFKRVHEVLGKLSLACAAMTIIYVGYRLALEPHYGAPPAGPAVAAAIGGLGLLCQLILWLGSVKQRWIVHRFAAERLRALKFRLFILATTCRDAGELAAAVENQSRRGIAQIEQDVLSGIPAVERFDPDDALGPRPKWGSGDEPGWIEAAHELYSSLRLRLQAEHATGRIMAGEESAHMPAALSQIFFGAAAILCLVDVASAAFEPGAVDGAWSFSPLTAAWLAFVAWFLFVASAFVNILEHGRAGSASLERYREYRRVIERIQATRRRTGAAGLGALIWDTERAALVELKDFYRDHRDRSYFV